jgi:hypothetical protein
VTVVSDHPLVVTWWSSSSHNDCCPTPRLCDRAGSTFNQLPAAHAPWGPNSR